MQCKLCGGKLMRWLEMPIDAKKGERTPFRRLMRCERCSVGMVTPQPRADQVADFYRLPAYYTHGASHMRHVEPRFRDRVLTKLAWKVDHPTPFDPEEIKRVLPTGATVCDLGCGHGEILKRFQDLGFHVVGVEPDPVSRQQAEDSGVRVLPGTAEALPQELRARQFDLVIMTHSLEHCIDPLQALANAYRLTRQGGYFYCEVPNCGCRHFESLKVCSETFDSPRHLWFFEADSLLSVVRSMGYVVDRWCFSGFTRHHSPNWRAWETAIFDRLAAYGENIEAERHTFFRSLLILAKSAFAPAHKKYDCMGLLSRKTP